MDKDALYDVLIIGGGPAGLTAGLYVAGARLNGLLLEQGAPGGRVLLTDWVENFPGFPDGLSGQELMDKIQKQAKKFGLKIEAAQVLAVSLQKDKTIEVRASTGSYRTQSLIIAAGVQARKLGVPGETELIGRGVSFCAVCDGPLFKDKKVVVVGGGDAAAEEALFLTKFASRVYLVHRRDKLRAAGVLAEKVQANPKIEVVWNANVTRIGGGQKVESVQLRDVLTGQEKSLACDGVFVYVGTEPNTAWLKGAVDLDERGFVLTEADLTASRPGVFAAGDVRAGSLRQIVTACGDGAAAFAAAQRYIEKTKTKNRP